MQTSEKTRAAVLVAGIAVGAAIAASGLLEEPPDLPAEAVARVDDRWIARSTLEARARAAAGGREPTLDERRRTLERLVEEELLLAHAIDTGLIRSDPALRSSVTAAVLANEAAKAHAEAADEDRLRELFEEHQDSFARPGWVRVEGLFFRLPTTPGERPALPRALEARKRLAAGDRWEKIDADLADEPDRPLGDRVKRDALADALGPAGARVVEAIPRDTPSEPIRTPAGYWVVVVRERGDPEPVSFEEVRGKVALALRQATEGRRLDELVRRLRRNAEIIVGDLSP